MMQDKAPTLCCVGASSQNQKGPDSIFGLYVASPPEKMDKELTDCEVFVNSKGDIQKLIKEKASVDHYSGLIGKREFVAILRNGLFLFEPLEWRSKGSPASKLLFDSKELIVFRHPVRSGRGAGLDLPGIGADC